MVMNVYGRQLTAAEIDAKRHRDLVGGMWDEVGILQLEFLKARGLEPSHRLIDVGCGAMRGGIHFIRFLDVGNYYGMDVNASLIEAGKREIAEANLGDRQAHFLVTDDFKLSQLGTQFDH